MVFAFAGDFKESISVEAVDADVEFVQTGGAVGGKQLGEFEGVGGQRQMFDT